VNANTLGTEDISRAGERTYDAFISYSHKGEHELARTLERILWTFGRSWYQVRGIRTYRDESNLAAEPDLWPRIEEAIRQSGCLILLASADSARSTWVPREVHACIESHGLDGLCIVQTGGVLTWTDGISPDEMSRSGNAALSLSVWKLFADAGIVPLVVDMRSFRSLPQNDLHRNADFLSRVASVAAKVLHTDKEAIWGEYHRAQRRRTVFLSAICMMLLALLVAVGVLFSAEIKAKNVATARYLAVEGLRAVREGQTRLGLVLLVESLRKEQTPEALGGLFSLISQDPHLSQQRFPLTEPAFALAFNSLGSLIAAGHKTGIVTIHNLAGGLGPLEKNFEAGNQSNSLSGAGGIIEFLTFSPTGDRLVGLTSAGELIEWNPSSTGGALRKTTIGPGKRDAESEFLTLDARGQTAIVGDYTGELVVFDADRNSSGKIDRNLCGGDPIALSANGDLLACGESSEKFRGVRIYDRRVMKLKYQFHLTFPNFPTSLAFSASDNALLIGSEQGSVFMWRFHEWPEQPAMVLDHEPDPYSRENAGLAVELLKVSQDDRFLVTAYRGASYLWHIPSGELLTKLPGYEPTAFTFSQNGRYLAVADVNAQVRIWDLSIDSWIDWACRNADHDLTSEQWERYLPTEPHPRPCTTR
jgi:WD40 repeat protein